MQRRIFLSAQTFVQLVRLLTGGAISIVVFACSQPAMHSQMKGALPASVIDQTIPPSIKNLVTTAEQQFNNHQTDDAIASLERALRIQPRQASVWSRLAHIYLQTGQPQKAIEYARRSNSYARNDHALQAFNQTIIQQASQQAIVRNHGSLETIK